MERAATVMPVSIRPLALPAEHGGWGFVLEPIVLALLVAPSWAGVMIGVAALAAFLARQPLQLAIADWRKRRRYPRTIVCERLVAIYGFAIAVTIAAAIAMTDARILLPFVVAASFGIVQFALDLQKRGRMLSAEVAGVVAAGATAAAIALAADRTIALAATLWLLTILRSVPAILFVRAALGKGNRMAAVVLHIAALGIAIALWLTRLAPLLSIAAMFLLLGRTVFSRGHQPARRVGMRELAFGAITVILIAAGFAF